MNWTFIEREYNKLPPEKKGILNACSEPANTIPRGNVNIKETTKTTLLLPYNGFIS